MSRFPQRLAVFGGFSLLLLFSGPPALSWDLEGQATAQLRVEENLRAEPRGVILGRVLSGTVWPVLTLQEQWVEVELTGWIWTPSLQVTERLGFDVRVSVSPNENLREEPSGTILARLVEGTLLGQAEEESGWTRVRRAVWLWRESVDLTGEASLPASGAASQEDTRAEPALWTAEEGGSPLLAGPDGDTLALAQPGTELRVLAREGNWVRVRLEGWTWAPERESEGDVMEESAPEETTPAQVVSEPDRFRGRVFSWELQFVSVERAEKIRTDFYEGEPFLLTRVPSEPGLFVYVAVPPDQIPELEGLIPLERIQVVGRLRTGAAALTGNPILDLMELTRGRDN